MPEFRKWRSINKFSDAYVLANKFGVGEFKYRGKIKLHGSNAGIHFENGVPYPQKRSDFVTIGNDNAGFAQYVSTLTFGDHVTGDEVIFYGEWAGPGIQKNDAVSTISSKSFFVFTVFLLPSDPEGEPIVVIEPDEISELVKDFFGADHENQHIYVLPWETDIYEIDFSRQNTCQKFIDSLMKTVDKKIAEKDPYIEQKFGIEGPGEGFVMYPMEGKFLNGFKVEPGDLISYIFKAKTEAHTVQKTKNRNHVAPEKPEGIEDFIESFFTEQRFEQMLNQIGGKATKEKTGQFMKAIMSDVYKESEQEVLIADFEWKDVPKYAAPVAKRWWFAKCEAL